MCGRFTLTRSAAEVAEHFGLSAAPELAPRFNIAPTQEVAVVREGEGARALERMHWGLVPHWAKHAQGALKLINARIETSAEKPAFREAIRLRRCLVPADGFYEWKGRGRQPHHVTLPGGGLFGIAGLYEHWQAPGGATLTSVALLTCDAAPNLRALHDRMPVILDSDDYAAWLSRERTQAAAALAGVSVSLGERLVMRPVGRRVNSVRHDDAACLEAESLPLFDGMQV